MYNFVCLLLLSLTNFAKTDNLITATRSAYMGKGQASTLVYSVPISPESSLGCFVASDSLTLAGSGFVLRPAPPRTSSQQKKKKTSQATQTCLL